MKFLLRVVAAIAVLIFCFASGYLSSSLNLFSGILGSGQVNLNIVTVLERVQAMSQLTTTRFTFSNIVEGSVEMPPVLATLYGQGLAMVAVGYVDAGIDLGDLTAENIRWSDNILTIHLPPPTLQDCFFDESDSYVVSRSTGLFARPLPNLETRARQLAIEKFRQEALNMNILEEARTRAEITVGELVNSLVAEGVTVQITSAPGDPEAPFPESCG